MKRDIPYIMVIDPADAIAIRFRCLPDTGETHYEILHAGERIRNTLPNARFRSLVGFYRDFFDTVDVEEVAL